MRKSVLLFGFFLISFIHLGCKKGAKESVTTQDSENKKQISLNSFLTPGQMHDITINNYFDKFGANTDGANTYAKIYTMTEYLITQFVEQSGISPDSIPVIVNHEMNAMWDQGCFNPDSTFAYTGIAFSEMLVSIMPNASIKNAWTNIIANKSPDFATHLAYAKATINSLTGLTTEEIEGNNGSLSVLSDSYVTWGAKLTDRQKKEIIAESDAQGWVYGWNEAGNYLWGAINPLARSYYANAMAAKTSLMAYFFVKDR